MSRMRETMPRTKLFLLIIAMLMFVILGISGGLLNVAWTYMQDSFNVTVGAIGILLLFATSGSLIAAMLSGTLIGRYGIGRVALISIMIISLGLLGIGLSPLWIVLLGVIFFNFLGRGMIDSSMNSFVSENYGTSAMNWLHAAWGLGLTIAPFIMSFILIDLNRSWRTGYFLMAAVTFLFGLIILFNLKQWNITQTDEHIDDEKLKIVRATASEALREPAVLWSILFFFLYGGVEIGAGQLVNTLFVEGRAINQETASLWLSMYWGSFTAGRILLGIVALRINDAALLAVSFFMMLIGAFLLTTNTFPMMNMLSLILLGSGLAGIFPTLISQTPARVGKRFSAQSIGFQVGFAGFGGAIIPGIIGYFAQQFSLEYIAYGVFAVALLVIPVYLILAKRYPAVKAITTA